MINYMPDVISRIIITRNDDHSFRVYAQSSDGSYGSDGCMGLVEANGRYELCPVYKRGDISVRSSLPLGPVSVKAVRGLRVGQTAELVKFS